jgi:hypothetical protein
MSTVTVSPLRQRMIEDMNARLRGDAEGPYSKLQAVFYVSHAVPGHGHDGGYACRVAAAGRTRRP